MRTFTWFTELFGFKEPVRGKNILSEIQAKFELSPSQTSFRSLCNNREFQCGQFSTPTVKGLRAQVLEHLRATNTKIDITLEHIATSGVLELHAQYPLATFQAASQFNCLEFPSFHVTPEDGITAYTTDLTQGPACALACPAGTLFRNYFAPVSDPQSGALLQQGQTKDRQINNLDLLLLAIENDSHQFIEVTNGYTFSQDEARLRALGQHLLMHQHNQHRDLVDLVKIGWQSDTEIVYTKKFEEVKGEKLLCSQLYCSALSVAYSGVSKEHWAQISRIVLQGAYEASAYAAILNLLQHQNEATSSDRNHSDTLFLTFLGGGVFGNDMEWICDAINNALKVVQAEVHALAIGEEGKKIELKVKPCHFRRLNEEVVRAVHL